MGSLMSGWSSSSVLSEKQVRLTRNRSLTKEEVEAFWWRHGGRPTENGEPAAAGSPLAARRLEVMRSMPPQRGTRGDDLCLSPRSEPSSPAARGEGFFLLPENAAPDDAAASMSRGWWTRSSWAFLNDPPKEKEEVLLRIVTGNA